ncbi:pyridoxamine 5'-phosphate oxidase family protein [Cellulomonas sp. PhB143]|uniref:pyridoxamine 5'-phosphate oxidase family protein n=1 Tax=Cellulomonas sp. PhB143 TaxID=2485186 RepID=UPI000F47C456|nr:pyridoxamine 5'-phosphate oxidase family protein [Cellulomonas sp. PhB143]ROS76615.1 pyridoxamine 5'-phosphate oxidase-like protein [Cellulomonas sp. PhB143]
MDTVTTDPLTLLATQEVGRLAVSAAGVVDIFPVNFVLDAGDVVIGTTEGSKLVELTINERVAFECDSWDETDAWSVVVKGRARRLTHDDEIARAENLGLRTWSDAPTTVWLRLTPEVVSGRHLER